MKVNVKRVQIDPDVTIGRLTVDGSPFECWTLEDPVRPDGVKIHGETAIPAGTYVVELTQSPRFKRVLPLLLNVANFVGVRIHTGNSVEDTHGCLLVGMDKLAATIGRSRIAFDALFDLMQTARARGEGITLEIA